jgi:peptidoglycan hydrolase-like protein with peptidoglycan-binding domain
MQDKMNMNTQFGPYDSKEEVEDLQRRLNEVGFSVDVDGMYGKKTKRAEREYALYVQNNIPEEKMLIYNNPDLVNMAEKPFHLLIDGDANLFDKALKNPMSLTDEEYGRAFPDAKTNSEILRDSDIFEFLKRQ